MVVQAKLVAPVILFHVAPLNICHCTVPTFPVKVKVVVDPEQIEAVPVIVPDTEVGAIIIAPETALVIGDEHVLLTTQ